jgi:cephalosporin hydroxylase
MKSKAINLTAALAIEGFMNWGELAWLADQATRARIIIEIGSFQGRSTRALADHCPGRVFAVDPWNDYVNDDGSQAAWIIKDHDWPTVRANFNRNLADHLASGRVVAVPHPSVEARPLFHWCKGADLIFIDGDHRYEAVLADIDTYRSLVRSGGILSGHDWGRKDWPGVQRAVVERFSAVEHCKSIWWVRP